MLSTHQSAYQRCSVESERCRQLSSAFRSADSAIALYVISASPVLSVSGTARTTSSYLRGPDFLEQLRKTMKQAEPG